MFIISNFKKRIHNKILLNIDEVYVCHYSKLTDRKFNFTKTFQKNFENNYKIIELFDITDIQINMESYKNIYKNIFSQTKFGRKLSLQEISIALKHIYIITEAFKNEYESILIFEDDVKLVNEFTSKFNNYIKQLPINWDILWIGGSHNLHIKNKKSINVYQTNAGSRCSHAYILSKSGIKKIITEINNINMPIDFYFNELIINLNLNNYWAEPPLAYQNTKFKTSIQTNENIIFRFLARLQSAKQFLFSFIKKFYG
jgi:GR25 family glycosyltransferase involved in LPS biosynthesis